MGGERTIDPEDAPPCCCGCDDPTLWCQESRNGMAALSVTEPLYCTVPTYSSSISGSSVQLSTCQTYAHSYTACTTFCSSIVTSLVAAFASTMSFMRWSLVRGRAWMCCVRACCGVTALRRRVHQNNPRRRHGNQQLTRHRVPLLNVHGDRGGWHLAAWQIGLVA